jgi:hypothetical protein
LGIRLTNLRKYENLLFSTVALVIEAEQAVLNRARATLSITSEDHKEVFNQSD